MEVMEIFVFKKNYDTEEAFTLYSDNPLEIDILVGICLKNGFKDIRISKANAEDILNYHRNKGEIKWNTTS